VDILIVSVDSVVTFSDDFDKRRCPQRHCSSVECL